MNRKTPVSVRILQYTILVIMGIFALYPIWFAFLASGRASERLYTFDLLGMFLPTEWSWRNYQVMLFERPFLTWLTNSLKVASITTVFALIICTSAAFALSRFRFRGREGFLILLLALSTFPGVLSLVAIAQLLTAIGLYGNHLGLILAYAAGTIVFCTWNLKGYFDTIPIELEEAAMLDGCGPVQAFMLIALPLARPALATTAILAFMGGWGDFIFASVLVPAPDAVKLAVPALYSLANSMSVPWGYELYEAAEVDGASWWKRTMSITLPLIRPAVLPATVLTSITAFQMFGTVFAITAGGPQTGANTPGATEFVMLYAYRQIFQTQNYGIATAFAVLIFLMLFGATLYSLRITKITKGAY